MTESNVIYQLLARRADRWVTFAELWLSLPVEGEELDAALDDLVAAGRIEEQRPVAETDDRSLWAYRVIRAA